MNAALVKRQEQLQDSLRNELRKEKIQYKTIKNTEHFGTSVTLVDASQRSKAERNYSSVTSNLRYNRIG